MKEHIRNEKILEAMRSFLLGVHVNWEEKIKESDWEEIFTLSMRHQILPMVYEAVYSCPAFSSIKKESGRALKRQVIRQITIQSRKTEEFLQIYQKLIEKELTPLVVKGLICRNLYQDSDYRSSGDEDVLIPVDQFTKCHKIFLEHDLKPVISETDVERSGEVSYHRTNGLLHIELHKELFPSESEAYGDLNTFFEHAFEQKICLEIRGQKIYTLCYTDHLLYLILHAFKHFLHSGFGIRQVCDVIIYANTYGSEIDWDDMLEKCRDVHADIFAAALFDIGEKYLTFDPEKACYPKSWQELKVDGDELLEDLMDSGVFGDSSMSRRHSSNITLQAMAAGKQGKKARVSLVQTLFPDKQYMERTFGYLRKYPFLLPVAWVMRLGKYVRETRKNANSDMKASIEIGTRRVDLLRKYKIIT